MLTQFGIVSDAILSEKLSFGKFVFAKEISENVGIALFGDEEEKKESGVHDIGTFSDLLEFEIDCVWVDEVLTVIWTHIRGHVGTISHMQ